MIKKRRVMLKLSGEALSGEGHFGFDPAVVAEVASQVKDAVDDGIEVALVIGGGNFWRGRTGLEIDHVKSDEIGMLATAMNCLYVSEVFRKQGMETAVFGAFEINGMIPLFNKDIAVDALSLGKVVFFSGGTGHPYFSTDSGTVLRAIEIEADTVLLAKAVDGVYDSDPNKEKTARFYDKISIDEVIEKRLQVIDLTASVLARENHMPLVIFSLNKTGAISRALRGEREGTIITA